MTEVYLINCQVSVGLLGSSGIPKHLITKDIDLVFNMPVIKVPVHAHVKSILVLISDLEKWSHV